MDGNVVFGIVLTVGSLSILTVLVLWSQRRIDAIASRGLESAREIMRELDGD